MADNNNKQEAQKKKENVEEALKRWKYENPRMHQFVWDDKTRKKGKPLEKLVPPIRRVCRGEWMYAVNVIMFPNRPGQVLINLKKGTYRPSVKDVIPHANAGFSIHLPIEHVDGPGGIIWMLQKSVQMYKDKLAKEEAESKKEIEKENAASEETGTELDKGKD